MNEEELIADADRRAREYLSLAASRRVFPSTASIEALGAFEEPLPATGEAERTLAMLDELGSPATVASNGPNYYGFVIGASLPAAAAAERLALAWDQCASSHANSPVADAIERQAGRWLLDILDLPGASAVSFGTSASACGLVCLSTARRELLARAGWNFDKDGLSGAPDLRVVIPELAHITVIKALRILGFGTGHLVRAPVDAHGRLDPKQLPELDDRTILCLQAGEVNTGEFDPFAEVIPVARKAGAWVHVDGAFGLWARANPATRALTDGIELADSWTTDGHKWLNTPYDGAVAICRDAAALAKSMNSDAEYASSSISSQKNLGLEFSRRARGIPIWAALRSLGSEGVAELVSRHCRLARIIADGLRDMGIEVLNRVVLNQVLARCENDAATNALREAVVATGSAWFGPTRWDGRDAFRISVSSWRTRDDHVEALLQTVAQCLSETCASE